MILLYDCFMYEHTVTVTNHLANPVLRKDTADILIQPPIDLAELRVGLTPILGAESERVTLLEVGEVEGATFASVEAFGEINERGLAIKVLAERACTLANQPSLAPEMTAERPFNTEGWLKIREQVYCTDTHPMS